MCLFGFLRISLVLKKKIRVRSQSTLLPDTKFSILCFINQMYCTSLNISSNTLELYDLVNNKA